MTMAEKHQDLENFIPVNEWGVDHWSTLAYIGTVMVDLGKFQVGYDPRMRHGRRHHRVMIDQCPSPSRVSGVGIVGPVMSAEHGTRLKDKSVVERHDDWHCVQDMIDLGLFDQTEMEPSDILTFSDKGHALVAELTKHKSNGGKFVEFEPQSV